MCACVCCCTIVSSSRSPCHGTHVMAGTCNATDICEWISWTGSGVSLDWLPRKHKAFRQQFCCVSAVRPRAQVISLWCSGSRSSGLTETDFEDFADLGDGFNYGAPYPGGLYALAVCRCRHGVRARGTVQPQSTKGFSVHAPTTPTVGSSIGGKHQWHVLRAFTSDAGPTCPSTASGPQPYGLGEQQSFPGRCRTDNNMRLSDPCTEISFFFPHLW